MRCLNCRSARAIPAATSANATAGSAFQLCDACAVALCPVTSAEWLALAQYRYPQWALTTAQREGAARA